MPDAAPEISRADLLLRLREHGVEVTPDQLVRWHKRGLLPRPRRQPLGRGRGMESRYPLIALPQAYATRLLLDVFPRDLDSVGWCLWCFGFPVDELARSWLVEEVGRLNALLREGLQTFEEERSTNPISALAEGRVPRGWGAVRRRVGWNNMETVALRLHEVLLGEFDPGPYRPEEDYEPITDAIDAQLGQWGRSPTDRKALTKDAPEALQLVAKELNLAALQQALTETPVPVLRRVRDEAQTLFRRSAAFPGIEQALLPPPFFLYWFAVRVASPTLRTEVAKARQASWGSVEPPLFVRVVLEQRKKKPGHKKTTRSRKKRR